VAGTPAVRRAVLTVPTLTGALVRLEPLLAEHAPDLAAAAARDRSQFAYTWVPDGVEDACRYVRVARDQLEEGRAVPFAVRSAVDGRVVGSTRFLDLEVFVWPPPLPSGVARGPAPTDAVAPTVAEIGSTWYAADAQRTGINVECKLLMLQHAFESWQVLRVTLKTDARNSRSRRAIERLGATSEGVRRVHLPATDGTVRDSAYYSIVRDEWPTVRDGIIRRLASHQSSVPALASGHGADHGRG
jgi:RimJ/RimL family protein N-acetyltransferase